MLLIRPYVRVALQAAIALPSVSTFEHLMKSWLGLALLVPVPDGMDSK